MLGGRRSAPHLEVKKRQAMIPEKIFYKFKNINDYAYDSLKNKYLYFSTQPNLNDPDDCRIPFEYDSTNKKILNWIKYTKEIGRNMDGIDLEKIPFDTVAKVRAGIASGGELKRIIDTIAECYIKNFHVLCLTDSYINEKMWNHKDYGNDYFGICIGYRAFQLQYPKYCIKSEKQSNTRIPKFLECAPNLEAFILTQVEYDNDRKHAFNIFEEKYDGNDTNIESKNSKNLEYNILHKTKQWGDEKEYRGFYFSKEKNDNSQVKYPDEILESITFGYNVPQKEIDDITSIIRDNYSNFQNINFFIARKDENLVISRDQFYI
jgi:hypothetical protein